MVEGHVQLWKAGTQPRIPVLTSPQPGVVLRLGRWLHAAGVGNTYCGAQCAQAILVTRVPEQESHSGWEASASRPCHSCAGTEPDRVRPRSARPCQAPWERMSPLCSRCSRGGVAAGEPRLNWAPSLAHVRRLLKTRWIITEWTHPHSRGSGQQGPGKPQALLRVDKGHDFIRKQQRAHKGAGTEPQAEVLRLAQRWAPLPLENHFPLLQVFLYKTDTPILACDKMYSANEYSGKAEGKLDHLILTVPGRWEPHLDPSCLPKSQLRAIQQCFDLPQVPCVNLAVRTQREGLWIELKPQTRNTPSAFYHYYESCLVLHTCLFQKGLEQLKEVSFSLNNCRGC